jgi:NADPH:quinone reductase-like Zn-dependent oxidoreductase
MIGFITTALFALRRRDYVSHGAFMTRAYALGSAAGTQFFTFLPWLFFESIRTVTGNAVIMAAGWIINIVVAEVVLRRRARRRSGVVSPTDETMRAVLHERYGGPELLRVARVARPKPVAGQLLVRVRAASINSMEQRLIRANPFLVRLQNGLLRPKRPILGADLAGVVEAVGAGVTEFSKGDEVFGEAFFADGLGAFAEYVCVRKDAVIHRPAQISVVEAAALPLASVTALQAVRDHARVRAGYSVLIQGAGGGVGAFLVQIAKAYGAHVTAICGPRSVELVSSLGADRVLDYTREPLTENDRDYDAIFGVNGYRPLGDYKRRLAPRGVYVMVGGAGRQIFEALLLGTISFAMGTRRMAILTIDESRRATDLAEVVELVLSGRVRSPIDRIFALVRAADAIRYAESGHVRGKVVLDVVGEAMGPAY